MATSSDDISGLEAVNGKVDLGFRRLLAAHVENATTIYAYVESDIGILEDYKKRVGSTMMESESNGSKNHPNATTIKEGSMYAIYSDKDACWLRGRVEQPKAGPGGSRVRVRLVDIGRGDLFPSSSLYELPADLDEAALPVKCTRYKMSDLKPRGRDEGFSAHDRERGAIWLRELIDKYGPVIKAKCHRILNYKGGIMFEGEVGGKNINQMAIAYGLAVINPAATHHHHHNMPKMNLLYHHHHHHQPAMMQHSEWDADYLEYGGINNYSSSARGGHNNIGRNRQQQQQQQKPPAVKNESNGGGFLPIPGGYNPYNVPEQPQYNKNQTQKVGGGSQNQKQEQKLKQTLQSLEGTLAKRNKEIAELKKMRGGGDNNDAANAIGSLAQTVARVQMLRLEVDAAKETQRREKVADSARLVRDVHRSLAVLTSRSEEADKACDMLTQCQDQIKAMGDQETGLEATLEGAKKAVAKYAGGYMHEWATLRGHLDDGCEVLQRVLERDVPGPQVKINVAQLEAAKRREVVEVASHVAENWAKEDKKETAKDKSDEALSALLQGLNEVSNGLKAAASGQWAAMEDKSLPNINLLIKKTQSGFNNEMGLLSPPGSAAAAAAAAQSSSAGVNNGVNHASVMATLAKAITICLAEKNAAEEKQRKYSDILQTI